MTNSQAKSELMQIYMSLSEEKKQALDVLMAQADGEYISKSKMLMFLNDMRFGIAPDETVADDDERREREAQVDVLDDLMEVVEQMPTVDIPQDHDGCKDCKYETYPEYYYPCCECKHNYNDFWKFKPHWKPYLEEGLTVQCSECGSRFEIATKFCPRCGVYNGEEIER